MDKNFITYFNVSGDLMHFKSLFYFKVIFIFIHISGGRGGAGDGEPFI